MFSKTQRGVYPYFITAIGSSTGGLKIFRHLITNYASHLFYYCIIVAQYRSEKQKSMLAQLLAKETWMQVIEAQQRFELRADFCFQKPAGLTQNFQVIERVVQTWASNKKNG